VCLSRVYWIFCHIVSVLLQCLSIRLSVTERGYCVRGDLCPYDHGVDPVVLDNVGLSPAVLGLPGTIIPLERVMAICYRLSIVISALSLTIRPHFSMECLQHSTQHGWVSLGQSLERKGLSRCKPNFNAIWERPWAFVCKRNCVDIFCRLTKCTNLTDRQTT